MSIIGEAVLSAFLQVLFDKLASPELLKFARQEQVYADIKKWEKILLKIHAVLDDAEEKQLTNQFVKIWLAELRDLAYDVEDILDEFATEAVHRGLIFESEANTSKLLKLIHTCNGLISSNSVFRVRMISKMKGITTRLQAISNQKNYLNLRENLEGSSTKVRKRLPTTSLVNETQVFGRERDKEAVLELLLTDYANDSKVCVIAIIGMGGVGKTTLAQLVFNDTKVKDSFDLKVWACVSDEFDVLNITKSILESITNRSVGSNLNLLQGRLQDILTEKRFLLVLDDVWNENYQYWDALCSPFSNGAPGSKILVTTRCESVASVMGSVAIYHLKELPYDSCLLLFTQLSLGTNNFDAHPSLKEIGEGIVEKCKGLPLAAKTLGSLLHTKVSQDEWEDIFSSKIWDLSEEQSGILPALRLSYHHLPSHLKQCFAYCSIFPKDYEFSKEELILLWMAEGFLQQPKGTKRMENLGAKYFDDLLSRSLFQQSTKNGLRYVMHDLINDLAQYVAGDVCFRLEERLGNVQKARHVSYIRNRYEVFKKFEVLYKAQNLRTFLPLPIHVAVSWRNFYITGNIMYELLPKLRRLRVLSLSGYCINVLPNLIGKLKHLRYLDLSHTLIKTLPESVSALHNLQSLVLHSCGALSKLPAGIVNLINLRHLDITNTKQLRELPLLIGKLKNLRTLTKFMVGNSAGSKLTELRDMLRLRGKLTITGLHNVENVFDAGGANLQFKHDLQELVMKWSSNNEFQNERVETLDIDVLDMLQPHKNLKALKIEFYAGVTFPSWIGHPSFSNLNGLTLKNCTKCSSLPSLGRLPFLEDLCIEGMHSLKSIGLEFYGEDSSFTPFPFLKILTFSDMLEWEDWCSAIPEEAFVSEFPSLCELCIRNCPKLVRRLPNYLPSLRKLDISKCPCLEVEFSRPSSLCDVNLEECKETAVTSVVNLISSTLFNLQLRGISNFNQFPERVVQSSLALKVMNIINCSELTTLRQAGDHMLLSRLEKLELCNCNNLKELPDGLFSFTSLADLKIKRCPKILSFPEPGSPFMLRHLILEECEALECLPEGIVMQRNNESNNNISHLESLEIIKCPSLKFFPRGELPASLKVLKIWDCMRLESFARPTLQNTLSLECLSVRKYSNLITLPECLHCFSHLIELHISYCAGLESFPERGLPSLNLRRFYVFNCPNLKSLPDNMQSLTALQHLGVSSCPGILSFPEGGLPSNLTSIRVSNCENLPHLSEWGLHRLLFLKDLTISGGCPNLVSFAQDCRLPATLISLRIGKLLNLESLSMALQHLTSLEVLEITECPKLRSLPKEGLPVTLSVLEILDCPMLKRQLLNKKGKYASIIANIPRVEIDEILLQ
ncbi:putative disease resistance RPP13-like protein 1 [Ricinus communis]|uniref:putative disease resistance RPP13-like protein 1 n=1 Tax=Ricinus communis TaxID=3988 RepID=UPI00201B0288|nr:putative disease resistance RPP13-like protein 1 [Ricinus communis]